METKPLSLYEIERRVGELRREIQSLLTGFLPEPEVSRRLGMTRQAMFKRPETIKRDMGGIKTPDGWWYREASLSNYRPRPGRRPKDPGKFAPFVK
jgi:hypothetical protein